MIIITQERKQSLTLVTNAKRGIDRGSPIDINYSHVDGDPKWLTKD